MPAPFATMPNILLSTDLSQALLSLMRRGENLVEAVEVGPWYTPQQIRAYREFLPGMPFHFHAADLVEEIGSPRDGSAKIGTYLACTGSPWVSIHLSIWQPEDLSKMKSGQQVPLPEIDTSQQQYIGKVKRLAGSIQVPVLIENVEPLPFPGYNFWARPDFICAVISQADCGFLLDSGHARLAAEDLGMPVRNYLQQLPLEQVVQVHVSGPRRAAGRLVDAHQPLQDEDYELLEFILAQTRPQVVTLEYIAEAEALRRQLARLRSICTGASGANP